MLLKKLRKLRFQELFLHPIRLVFHKDESRFSVSEAPFRLQMILDGAQRKLSYELWVSLGVVSDPSTAARDPVRDQVGEACLRLLAGAVPPKTMNGLRAEILAQPDAFPWQAVNDRIVAEAIPADQFLEKGLRAQRDWILRGGAAGGGVRRKKSMKSRGKGLLALLVARLVFFALYTVAVVALLILLKHRWPGMDVYALLDWLREALPALFGPR